jgi:hypothetical protein
MNFSFSETPLIRFGLQNGGLNRHSLCNIAHDAIIEEPASMRMPRCPNRSHLDGCHDQGPGSVKLRGFTD